MLDSEGQVLYVGKAKNLKNRVTSYFRKTGLTVKTAALVKRIVQIDVTVTETETEALILEHNLIKQYRPPFNILMRDDKSYPYIFISDRDPWPRLSFHRGPKKAKGTYFGPFPSVHAVRESMSFLQKVFRVRQCEDVFFKNRSRPCLQYQIKRCSAPCVGFVKPDDYAEDVNLTRLYLDGKAEKILQQLEREADKRERKRGKELEALQNAVAEKSEKLESEQHQHERFVLSMNADTEFWIEETERRNDKRTIDLEMEEQNMETLILEIKEAREKLERARENKEKETRRREHRNEASERTKRRIAAQIIIARWWLKVYVVAKKKKKKKKDAASKKKKGKAKKKSSSSSTGKKK